MNPAAPRRTPWPLIAVAGFAALLAAVPVLYLGVRISDAGPDGIATVLSRSRLPGLLFNTLLLGASVTTSAIVLGVLSALVLARLRMPAPGILAAAAVLPLAMPSYLAAFGWLATFPTMNGFWPSWLVLTLVTVPYVTLAATTALHTGSTAFSDVARTLGHGPVRVFFRVTWPSIRTATLAAALLVFLYTIADFGGVALFRYPVLTTAISQAYGATFDRNYAAILAASLVLVALVVLTVERRMRPHREFASSPSAPARQPARPGVTLLAVAGLLIAPVGAVVVPVLALLIRLVNAQTVRELDPARLANAALATLILSAAGALLAVLLALPIATLAARHSSRIARVIETAGSLPLALPGIVVGLGLVFFSLNAVPALYQSAAVLAFAYGLLFLPKAIGTVRASIERVPRSLEDVARTLGYGPIATWRRVTARLSRPGILVATLFITVTAMKELPATILLRPTGMNTLAIELWSKTSITAFGAAVPYAIALLALAAIPAVLLAPRADRVHTGVGA